MNAQIEALARKKDFVALHPKERMQVLAEMPEEEYNRLREVLRTAPRQYADAQAPASLRNKLMGHMASHAQMRRKKWLLGGSTPLWRAAAIFVLGMAVAMLVRKTTVVEKVVTEVQVKVDTIYRENIQWRERVVWKTKVVYIEKAPVSPIAGIPEKSEHPIVLPEFSSQELNKAAFGTSLGDTPELMQFFTQGEE